MSTAADTHEDSKGRMRVSRACTRCRSRKDKCDALRPSCSTCHNAGVPELCTYEPSTKKRGLPEGYVRGLEKLYSVLMLRLDGFEDVVVRLLGDERDALTRVWNHRVHGEHLHQTWKDSRILQHLEILLSAVEPPQGSSVPAGANAGHKRKRDNLDEADDSTAASPMRMASSMASPLEIARFSPKPVIGDVLAKITHSVSALDSSSLAPKWQQQQQQQQQQHPSLSAREKTFKLPNGASESVHTYFSSVHYWLPILDRGEMHKRCFEFSRGEVPVEASNDGLAKLAAALALLCCLQSPTPSSTGQAAADRTPEASYLYEISRQCIPLRDDGGVYVLGHVQALVLLVLADVSSNRWSQAWLSIGLASRVIQDLVAPMRPLAREERATYQACFILDTLIAFRLQRMPQLRRMQLPAYLIEDGHDEWEPVSAVGPAAGPAASSEPGFLLSAFNRVTDLFAFLNDRICLSTRNTSTNELDRLVLSHPHLLGDKSPAPVSSHKAALRAMHSVITCYFAETGLFGSKLLQTLNVASASLKQFPHHTSSLFATATLETIRQRTRAGSTGAASSSSAMSPAVMSSLGSWLPPAADSFGAADAPSYATGHPTPATTTVTTATTTTTSQLEEHLAQAGSGTMGMAFNQTQAPLVHQSPTMAPHTQNPIIPASPSFHGSEMDAIFLELAHLDTTEWAEGRNQSFKDFGFADAMAFEAFCNDPNRVFSNYQQSATVLDQATPGFRSSIHQEPGPGSRFGGPNVSDMSWIG